MAGQRPQGCRYRSCCHDRCCVQSGAVREENCQSFFSARATELITPLAKFRLVFGRQVQVANQVKQLSKRSERAPVDPVVPVLRPAHWPGRSANGRLEEAKNFGRPSRRNCSSILLEPAEDRSRTAFNARAVQPSSQHILEKALSVLFCADRHVLFLIVFFNIASQRGLLLLPLIPLDRGFLSREPRCSSDKSRGLPSTGYGACDPRYQRRDCRQPRPTPSDARERRYLRGRTRTREAQRHTPRGVSPPPLMVPSSNRGPSGACHRRRRPFPALMAPRKPPTTNCAPWTPPDPFSLPSPHQR